MEFDMIVYNYVKLQLHDAIYRLRFYSNSLIDILSPSNSHNNVASVQKNRADKSHRVIVALTKLFHTISKIYSKVFGQDFESLPTYTES